MEAPEGMKWIDVTYTARRIDLNTEGRGSQNLFEGEASMRILIDDASAEYLAAVCGWHDFPINRSLSALERILRAREELCRGKYVEGSIKDIRIVEDDDVAGDI